MAAAAPLSFSIPPELSDRVLRARLEVQLRVRTNRPCPVIRTRLDTFDERLRRKNQELEEEVNGIGTTLRLRSSDDGNLLGSAAVGHTKTRRPRFAWDLPDGPLKAGLAPLIDVRALLPVDQFRGDVQALRVLDGEDKTVVRMEIETERGARGRKRRRLRVIPVKGYGKALAKIRTVLERELNLHLEDEHPTPVEDARDSSGPALEPSMRADLAVKHLLRKQLAVMGENVDGIRRDLDSEFLHDFRVAVRRTRSLLSQVKHVLPAPTVRRFRREFAWLGAMTTPCRDLDVHLLDFVPGHSRVPETLIGKLAPLHRHLQKKRENAHAALVNTLDSARYQRLRDDWQRVLETPAPARTTLANAARPIIAVAGELITRTHRKVLREGGAIHTATPASALHDLRKRCKKLRYLLEFFRCLYPPTVISPPVVHLKRLQDNLGVFNDLCVQREALRDSGVELRSDPVANEETLRAMDELSDRLFEQQIERRREFSSRFRRFAGRKSRGAFTDVARSTGT